MENQGREQVEGKPTWRLAWGLWWRMFLMALGLYAIIAVLLVPMALFNVSTDLGQGTEETAKTEMAAVQTALLAGMAENSVGSVTAGAIGPYDDTKTVYYPETAYQPSGSFHLETYLHLPTHGTWSWDSTGIVVSGTYSGGGMTCTYDYYAYPPWQCTED